MVKRKETITFKAPKQRNFELIELQLKGLMRTRVVKNKKKEVKKFNLNKESSYYSNILQEVLQ